MPELSFIIPTYNRRNSIVKTLSLIKKNYPDAEIIVVDDGSTDGTEEEFQKNRIDKIIYIKNKINQGKGYSLRKGFQVASGQYLIFTDDDLPYGLDDINLVCQELKNGYPIVMAERTIFYDNIIKKIGRMTFNLFFKTFLGIKTKDTQAGLKGFSRNIGKKLFQLSFINRFAIDLEIVFLCRKLNYPIHFIPVKQLETRPSSLSIFNLVSIALDTLKIKFHHYELA